MSSQTTKGLTIAIFAIVMLLTCVRTTHALLMTYEISQVGFDDGTTMWGTFTAEDTTNDQVVQIGIDNITHSEMTLTGGPGIPDTTSTLPQLADLHVDIDPGQFLVVVLVAVGTEYSYQTARGISQILTEPDNLLVATSAEPVTIEKQNPVPEPTTLAMLGIGIAGLIGAGYRKRRKVKQEEKS